MGLSFFNAMRAKQNAEQAQLEKTSTAKVEVKEVEPEKPVETTKPEKDEEVSKKTDAEKLKGKKD